MYSTWHISCNMLHIYIYLYTSSPSVRIVAIVFAVLCKQLYCNRPAQIVAFASITMINDMGYAVDRRSIKIAISHAHSCFIHRYKRPLNIFEQRKKKQAIGRRERFLLPLNDLMVFLFMKAPICIEYRRHWGCLLNYYHMSYQIIRNRWCALILLNRLDLLVLFCVTLPEIMKSGDFNGWIQRYVVLIEFLRRLG